jgi:hypothetical protein
LSKVAAVELEMGGFGAGGGSALFDIKDVGEKEKGCFIEPCE